MLHLSVSSASFEPAGRTAMNQHKLRMPQRCRCLWNVFFLNICLGKHIRKASHLTNNLLPVWHWKVVISMKMPAFPQKCIQSLCEPREVHTLYKHNVCITELDYVFVVIWYASLLTYWKRMKELFLFPSWKLLFIGSIFYYYQQERQKLGDSLLHTAGMLLPWDGSCSFQKLPLLPVTAIFLFRDHSNFFIKDFLSF